MFGKRTSFGGNTPGVGEIARPVQSTPPRADAPVAPARRSADADGMAARIRSSEEVVDVRAPSDAQRDKEYFHTKSAIFSALIDSIDLSQLATMEQVAAREEIRDIVAEIIALKSIIMSISEQEDL
ncbi:MAG: CpaF family protein, partial [Cypionkella sp.]